MAETAEIVDNCLAYLNQGFNLLEEIVRNRFTNDERLAELLVIRCEESVYGLIILDRLTLSPVVRGSSPQIPNCNQML